MGSHPYVIRLLRGIFNLRPAIPKNSVTWDPQVLLNYLKKLSPVKTLSLRNLTYKGISLLWLLSGQRGQSIQLIDVRNVILNKNVLKISFGDLLKSSRPGFQQKQLVFKACAPDRRICIVTVLSEYLKRVQKIRKQGCNQ